MLRNSISTISFALLLVLVSFTGCMDDSDSDDTTVIQTPEDNTSNDETETNTTEETPEVYDGPLRILALHGGGDTPEGLENQAGMQDLMADLPEFEFFFADAPDDESLCDQCWYADPPGGKDEPNENRSWADISIAYLDQVVADHGPFYGILGYSQGVPMATVYIANSNTTFPKAMLFNGYMPTTHSGLNDTINEVAPLNTDALIFGGDEDVFVFGVEELEVVYPNPTVLVSSTADHHLPDSSDETYADVLAFFREIIDDVPEPVEPMVIPEKEWMRTIEGTQEESHGHFILATSDGGYLQIGETGFIPDGAKIMVAKLDSTGNYAWKKEFGTIGHNLGNSAIETSDGYVVVGALDEDSTIMKIDKDDGTVIFTSTFNAGGSDALENVVEITGGYAAVGYIAAEDNENTFYAEGEGQMVFLDELGTVEQVVDLNSYMSHAYRIASHNDELIISGLTEEALDYALVKMNMDGTVVWGKTYGGSGNDHNFAFDITSNGTIFLSGHTTSGTVNWDTYTMKVDKNGNKIWEIKVGNPRGFDPKYIHDEAWGIKSTKDGGCILIAGTGDEYGNYKKRCGTEGDKSNTWHVYLVKLTDNGSLEWEKTFGGGKNLNWAGEDIDLTEDGGAIIAVDNGEFGFLKIESF